MPELLAQVAEMSGYVERLNAAWDLHLAPRAQNAPTVISTFAGCGGSSLGYSMAGFRELLAVEWDQNAVDTFRLNFPDVPVYHGDIAALSVDQCLEMTGLQPGELDVFDGSPPCQGFSTAGKRQIDDPRNGLFREYVRLLRGLMPRVFVMENVSGMVKGKMKLVFAEILRELKASGYIVSARLMNAMYFDVPQSRQRMIFIGVREDLGIAPSHPVAQTKAHVFTDAVQGLTDPGVFDVPRGATVAIAEQLRPGEDGSDVRKRLGDKERDFSLVKLRPNRPCCTIPKSIRPQHFSGLMHPEEFRFLGDAELKRLASYPDQYHLIGTFEERWARIGNSVPPLFMRSIAEHIRDHILATRATDAMAAD